MVSFVFSQFLEKVFLMLIGHVDSLFVNCFFSVGLLVSFCNWCLESSVCILGSNLLLACRDFCSPCGLAFNSVYCVFGRVEVLVCSLKV